MLSSSFRIRTFGKRSAAVPNSGGCLRLACILAAIIREEGWGVNSERLSLGGAKSRTTPVYRYSASKAAKGWWDSVSVSRLVMSARSEN